MSQNLTQPRNAKGAPMAGAWRADNQRGGPAEETAPQIRLSDKDRQAVRRLHELVRTQVRAKYGSSVDGDEVFSQVMEIASKRLREGKMHGIEANIGYLRNTASNVAVDLAHPGQNSVTRTAKIKLSQRQEILESELGRQLSATEYEELANDIRMAAPPKRRAKIGYHLDDNKNDLALDRTVGEGSTTLGDQLEAEQQESMGVWESAASSMVAHEGVQPLSPDEGRTHYWRFAALADPSVPEPQRIPERSADRAEADVRAMGVDRMVRDYEDDNVASSSAESLFAPFGGVQGTTDIQREAVVEVLTRNAGHSDRLWALAMERARD